MAEDAPTSTYPGGINGLLAQMEARRAPLRFARGEALPPLDVDLSALAETIVPPAAEDPVQAIDVRSPNHRKFRALRKELAGRSELTVLHGLLVAHLRKRNQPPHTAALFERLWEEQADHLMDTLDLRWQVSAITTFGDHGTTPIRRQLGTALSVLFGTMKLYESERRYSNQRPDKPFPLDRLRPAPLPLEMDPFSIANGGLDVNMLGRLWRMAEHESVIQKLAQGLLTQVIHDPGTVFRRLRIMRQRLERKKARAQGGSLIDTEPRQTDAALPVTDNIAPVPARSSCGLPDWGVVCTTHATLSESAPWVAHYLDLGAAKITLFLDIPDPATGAFFGDHQKVEVIQCDAAYWEDRGKARPQAHQLRQTHNATYALRQCDLAYLAHFDIDEFLITDRPVAEALAKAPLDAAALRVSPVELLAPKDGAPRHFKRSRIEMGQPKALLETLYPTFGLYLSGGMISHTVGKVFVRTGIADTRFGIHTLRHRGDAVSNEVDLPGMMLAHLHCRDVEHFLTRVSYRLTRGSYRKSSGNAEDMRLSDVLTYLRREEGEAGLRRFFEEVCTARPELLEALDAHGMLATHDLNLASKCARLLGPLPASPVPA